MHQPHRFQGRTKTDDPEKLICFRTRLNETVDASWEKSFDGVRSFSGTWPHQRSVFGAYPLGARTIGNAALFL